MKIKLCIFKGWMGHGNVPDSKLHCMMANEFDISLLVMDKSETLN